MRLDLRKPEERAPLGLYDHGTIVASCSSCKKDLMVFQITKTNEELVRENIQPITTKVAVFCEKCQHMNKLMLIKGQFYPGCANDKTKFDVSDKVGETAGLVIFKATTNE
jgi:hypothetical protein